jgi:hypothetical protein
MNRMLNTLLLRLYGLNLSRKFRNAPHQACGDVLMEMVMLLCRPGPEASFPLQSVRFGAAEHRCDQGRGGRCGRHPLTFLQYPRPWAVYLK